MKLNLLILAFALSFMSVKSQTIYMCSGSNSTTATSGTIYDSGGPSGNYSSNEDCTFLISAPCGGNITLNFSFFDTELNYDFLAIYNGSTTTSPVLGSYWGTGNVPQMVANSGYMLLRFYSDAVVTKGGYVASWTTSNQNCPPVANFNYNINPCQGQLNFLDASTNGPTSWLWNFGDGNGSTLQNPVHTYTAAGTYPVTLISTNSFGSNTISKMVSVNPIVFKIGYNGLPVMNSAMSFTTDNTTGQVYTWNFGDGGFGGTANSIHTFTSIGSFNVSLTIATGSCVATKTMQVVVKDGVGIEQYAGVSFNASLQPNPFKGSSQLNLQLAKDSKIRIELVNQLGQLLQVISDGSLNAGEYRFDLNEIPPGIYYLKINEGNNSRTLKMVSMH